MKPVTRRYVLQGALVALSTTKVRGAFAQLSADALPPIIFAHGNGDHAALWTTTLWRFESNSYPSDRLTAFNFTDPLARSDDAVPQPGRSSTEDQLRELTAVIDTALTRTNATRVALISSSRGGYAIRNFIQSAGAPKVSHAIFCGVPNRGVFDWEENPGSEFNGRAPFLKRLNAGESDVVPSTAFLTLRSDGNDKYAQPDGRFAGRPGVPTGITAEGPTLRGATNIALGQLDHREVAFHPRAFREMYRFVTGREPGSISIVADAPIAIDGLVTGLPNGIPTNRVLAGATVEVHCVVPATGERQGQIHRRVTEADGRWGPMKVEPTWFLEFVIEAAGHPTTHIYRSPFPRSSAIVHLRPGRALGANDAGVGTVVTMSRPRGYFGIPRDVVLFDGREPMDVNQGVPTDSVTTLRLPSSEIGRPIIAVFNEERIVCRGFPATENHITIAELTY